MCQGGHAGWHPPGAQGLVVDGRSVSGLGCWEASARPLICVAAFVTLVLARFGCRWVRIGACAAHLTLQLRVCGLLASHNTLSCRVRCDRRTLLNPVLQATAARHLESWLKVRQETTWQALSGFPSRSQTLVTSLCHQIHQEPQGSLSLTPHPAGVS